MAAAMRRGRVGIMGTPFKGMGDFFVTPAKLRATLGPRHGEAHGSRGHGQARLEGDEGGGSTTRWHATRHASRWTRRWGRRTSAPFRLGLAVRRWAEKEKLTALTFNFLAMTKKDGYITAPVPRDEQVHGAWPWVRRLRVIPLTALLVGALLTAYPDTSFTEMFCPDWEHGRLFLSHMGEVNPRLLDGAPRLREMSYTYSATDNPAIVVGRFRAGRIVLVNLAPMADGYRLIIAPAEMLAVPGTDRMGDAIRGWFVPPRGVPGFLTAYKQAGRDSPPCRDLRGGHAAVRGAGVTHGLGCRGDTGGVEHAAGKRTLRCALPGDLGDQGPAVGSSRACPREGPSSVTITETCARSSIGMPRIRPELRRVRKQDRLPRIADYLLDVVQGAQLRKDEAAFDVDTVRTHEIPSKRRCPSAVTRWIRRNSSGRRGCTRRRPRQPSCPSPCPGTERTGIEFVTIVRSSTPVSSFARRKTVEP